MWIARDKNKDLYLFYNRPQRGQNVFVSTDSRYLFTIYDSSNNLVKLDSKLFPEVTWENSPVKFIVEKETLWKKILRILNVR